jgi:predicted Ser/Thr protein kinase
MTKKTGDRIEIQPVGGEAQITGELGKGGQGTVYKVEFAGKEYALKMK